MYCIEAPRLRPWRHCWTTPYLIYLLVWKQYLVDSSKFCKREGRVESSLFFGRLLELYLTGQNSVRKKVLHFKSERKRERMNCFLGSQRQQKHVFSPFLQKYCSFFFHKNLQNKTWGLLYKGTLTIDHIVVDCCCCYYRWCVVVIIDVVLLLLFVNESL